MESQPQNPEFRINPEMCYDVSTASICQLPYTIY